MPLEQLVTERLCLRDWRDEDVIAFRGLNADGEVMRYFPSVLSWKDSDELAERIRAGLAERGWGLWALEVLGGPPFIGFVGLAIPGFAAPFMPAVEVGWRLARAAWGQGYATEAARAAVAFGFTRLALAEVVSFTAVSNQPSRRVMEKLGMARAPEEDFEHPRLAPGHPLRRHVLYRLTRSAWAAKQPTGPG